jgi:hypothetical protein
MAEAWSLLEEKAREEEKEEEKGQWRKRVNQCQYYCGCEIL